MTSDLSKAELVFHGTAYINGQATGTLLPSSEPLSFWGGVNPSTGEIVDRHHELSGRYLECSVLAIPSGRGSCSASGVILELLRNGKGPNAIIFERQEEILTLGVMIAEEIFGLAIPIVRLMPGDFRKLLGLGGARVEVRGGCVRISSKGSIDGHGCLPATGLETWSSSLHAGSMNLSPIDQAMLSGGHGEAARVSMRTILRMARLLGAKELMDVSQVHVDGCLYTGPASLAVAEKLRDLGGRVRVPTSLNSISIDLHRWRAQRVDPVFATNAKSLARAYIDMGAQPTFTCAPYQLESAPKFGEQVAWAESNAVVYANSVLGARTMKYPDFLDIAIALTGRAPKGGPHLDANRLASLVVTVADIGDSQTIDDSFYPLLGYHVGSLAANRIPVIVGISSLAPTKDNLKAFGAAFATLSSAPMFHILGVTPEAATLGAILSKDQDVQRISVSLNMLSSCWDQLNSASPDQDVGLTSLGNPHFSLQEIRQLAQLCQGRRKRDGVTVIVTCSRACYGLATQAGLIKELENFGIQFVTDTCWCMIGEPVIMPSAKAIMTNSAKYAHYGPGLTGRQFTFGSLAQCVDAACTTDFSRGKPLWLQ
jgi:predicted aconitase/predicted aconitase with swiveling domain